MEPIDRVVAQDLRAGLESTELSVFGTAEPTHIAETVVRFCQTHLGETPAGARFYAASVGCVLGLVLESGRDVVMKAYQPRWRPTFLAAVQEAQQHAAWGGLPCASPLLPPTRLTSDSDTCAIVESWLPDPGMRAISSEPALWVSATGLAQQISLCTGLEYSGELLDHPMRRPAVGLYPEPHSPHFDFGASSVGADWIDALATRAAQIRDADATNQVVGHTDWSARNIRFDEHRLLAVYDWDSLALVEESTAVGQAAMTWRVTAELGGTTFPTVDEVNCFIGAYETAAGHELTASQWRAAGAAAAYLLAYTARCEHSLEFAGIDRPDPRAARDRLVDAGEQLLAASR